MRPVQRHRGRRCASLRQLERADGNGENGDEADTGEQRIAGGLTLLFAGQLERAEETQSEKIFCAAHGLLGRGRRCLKRLARGGKI
jgi:hypothetical protein